MWLSSGRSGVAGVARDQLEVGAAHLQAPVARGREAELLPAARGRRGVARAERNVIEVELRVRLRLDEDDLEALPQVDLRVPAVERGDAQPDPGERALLAWPLGVEERQLAPPRVGAEQREPVGLLDHALPEPRDRDRGHPLAVGDPERDVIERQRLHRLRIAAASRGYFRRSTARCSCSFVIFERPSMPMCFASS